MLNPQQAYRRMKALAVESTDVVSKSSAGEYGRRKAWGYFIKNVPHDYTLLELADECFAAMTEEQRKQFISKCVG